MKDEADVCVIGSGAGGGPVAATLAEAGFSVVVLEKGPWLTRDQFLKDEITFVRRKTVKPSVDAEPQVEAWKDAGQLRWTRTGYFRNPQLVGGASVMMSGFFLRLKPNDFRQRSEFGPVAGAQVSDWPITYDDLEPYYDRVEKEVGVSGIVTDLPKAIADRRSSPDFPMGPTEEHPLAWHIDDVLGGAGYHPFPLPRAVLSENRAGRGACNYSGYCGSYGCTTGAKGTSLLAFVPRALATKRCVLRPRATVSRLESDERGRVVRAHWTDVEGGTHQVDARIFVVACQAVESARLLLNSRGPKHPAGLANRSGLVGRNLIFSTFGSTYGDFRYADHESIDLASDQPFINRVVQDHYVMRDRQGAAKGGTLAFIRAHPNPVSSAVSEALLDPDKPVWGRALKERLKHHFRDGRHVEVEAFGEWLPNPGARVSLDPRVRDRRGLPVARIFAQTHPRSRETAGRLVAEAKAHLGRLGATAVREARGTGGPSVNLVGGTCRFGTDPRTSVLDPDCRAHDAQNLYVTDGSFMPSGGSVPFTFTIYANALRVADRIVAALGGPR